MPILAQAMAYGLTNDCSDRPSSGSDVTRPASPRGRRSRLTAYLDWSGAALHCDWSLLAPSFLLGVLADFSTLFELITRPSRAALGAPSAACG